jgi:hypothetical protein
MKEIGLIKARSREAGTGKNIEFYLEMLERLMMQLDKMLMINSTDSIVSQIDRFTIRPIQVSDLAWILHE